LLQRQNVVNSLQLNEKRFSLNLHLSQLYNAMHAFVYVSVTLWAQQRQPFLVKMAATIEKSNGKT
jgi:hypothetical protein